MKEFLEKIILDASFKRKWMERMDGTAGGGTGNRQKNRGRKEQVVCKRWQN